MSQKPTFSAVGDQTTGRYIVTFREDDVSKGLAVLQQQAAITRLPSAADFADSAIDMEQIEAAGGVVVPTLGIAVVT